MGPDPRAQPNILKLARKKERKLLRESPVCVSTMSPELTQCLLGGVSFVQGFSPRAGKHNVVWDLEDTQAHTATLISTGQNRGERMDEKVRLSTNVPTCTLFTPKLTTPTYTRCSHKHRTGSLLPCALNLSAVPKYRWTWVQWNPVDAFLAVVFPAAMSYFHGTEPCPTDSHVLCSPLIRCHSLMFPHLTLRLHTAVT